jgi:ATP-dependent helicase HepA
MKMKAGRDRLLDQFSFRPGHATTLINKIKSVESDSEFEKLVLNIFRKHGIIVERLEGRTYRLWTDTMVEESFPGLSPARPLVTFDRKRALLREDMEFITVDHPAVRDSMDMILGSEKGNSSFALWKTKNENVLLLETIFVIECIAPEEMFVDRFLPPTPIRIVIDQLCKDVTDLNNPDLLYKNLTGLSRLSILGNSEIKHTLLPGMLKTAEAVAEKKSGIIIDSACEVMQRKLDTEINRLKELNTFNNTVREQEILLAVTERNSLNKIIGQAKPRLDAVRLIWKTGLK